MSRARGPRGHVAYAQWSAAVDTKQGGLGGAKECIERGDWVGKRSVVREGLTRLKWCIERGGGVGWANVVY